MAISEDRLRQLPVTLRPAVSRWFDRLEEAYGSITVAPDVEEQLLRVVAASEFAARVLLREWDYWRNHLAELSTPADTHGLAAFADGVATSGAAVEEVKSRLRRFRDRYMLGIVWREVAGTAALTETLAALPAAASI